MLFNSTFFIVIFLPLALIGWYLLQKIENPIYAKLYLFGMSLWFYGYYNPWYLFILLFSLVSNFFVSFLFSKIEKKNLRKLVLCIGLLTNIGLLFYFKYFNFFIDNCNFIFHTDWSIEKIALPLGISFFTFQQLSFVVDRYHNTAPHYSLPDYACFVTYFPQLVAGPIVLHDEFIPQLKERKNRHFHSESFLDGASLFILGLAKKVLLADVLAIPVNAEYANIAYLDAPSAWITIIFYMLELYFDFSGYCDMARGIGKMFGFELPENFNSPLMATSVKDFWRRWHMTLSRFLTTYIYIPLGGNRKGLAIKCRNLFIVFLVSGFWHGANWTFVVWGLLHGLAMIFETILPKLRFRQEWLNRIFTGIFVTLTFSVFRSNSLSDAWLLIQKLFMGGFKGFFVGMCNTLQIAETYPIRKALEMKLPQLQNPFYVTCVLLSLVISIVLIAGPKAEDFLKKHGTKKRTLLLLAILFIWAFVSLSQVSTFLYFNF